MADKNVNNNEQKANFYSKIHSTLSKYIEYLLCVPGTVLASENTIKMSKIDIVPALTILEPSKAITSSFGGTHSKKHALKSTLDEAYSSMLLMMHSIWYLVASCLFQSIFALYSCKALS